MSRQRSTIVHEFYCTQCGERGIPVHRKYGQFREVGHLKKLYCLSSGKETNHAECISASKYDSIMFFEEYESGNFDSEGNRILSLSEWKQGQQEPEELHQDEDLSEWYELFKIAVASVKYIAGRRSNTIILPVFLC